MNDTEKVINGLEEISDFFFDMYRKEISGYTYKKYCDVAENAIAMLKEQEARIKELEEKLRLLEYGDQDILQSGMMPAT